MKIKRGLIYVFLFLALGLTAQKKYHLVEKESYASCTDYELYDSSKDKVDLPVNVQKAMKCPFLLNIHEDIVTFSDSNYIKQHYISSGKQITILKIYTDVDGISGPVWSPDNKKVMFVVISQEKKHGYKEFCRIIVLSLNEEGEVIKKWKYDRPVNFDCGSICSCTENEDFKFIDNQTIEYKRHELINKNPGKKVKIILDI